MAKLRVEYGNAPLLEEELLENPIAQFEQWLSQAIESDVFEPNGMMLSTLGEAGRVSSRMVLLKAVDRKGFVFFTNKESRKGKQLALHPQASLTFWWKEIFRQVEVEGKVKEVSRKETVAYFHKRPKGAQLAAYISAQSEPLASRAELEEAFSREKKRFSGREIPCPKQWTGYRLEPDRMEFWQGRKNRLHDRFVYVKVDGQWLITRLSP